MKKIFIASICSVLLCLTSCASKQTPENEKQTQAPQTELSETSEEIAESENNETSEDNTTPEQIEETDDSDLSDIPMSSEDYPEPEVFEEPEIITLEPADEEAVSENEPAAEEVETEEPPVIVEVDATSTDGTENQNDTEAANEDATVTDVSDSDDDGITVIGGGIDITDEDADSEEELNSKEEITTPSRSVTLKKFEYLDITYPGTGWIYMGLTDNSKDLAYFGRKLGTKDTKFSLQARTAGTKIVHFYRNDPLTGTYLDDYIEVTILPENGSNKTHIEAPEYKLPVQKKNEPVKQPEAEETSESETTSETEAKTKSTTASQSQNDTSKSTDTTSTKTSSATSSRTTAVSAVSTTTQTTAASQENTTEAATQTVTDTATTTSQNPATLLQEAQVLYNEKEYSAALAKINQFFEYSTDNRDEALYLKGQILEAKSDIRDIKGAIDAYTSLTKNYPASKLWDSANKRIIYLKRFYLEVR